MKKVLVVDNDRILIGLLSRFLVKKGYQVETAENGLSALDLLDTFTPEIFFIDLVMPNINGKMLCRMIRSMERFDRAYIVILSAISAEEKFDIDKLGANAVIAKRAFNEMSEDIATVLDDPEGASKQCMAGEILGVQGVNRRGITEELLLAKRHLEIILEKMSEGIVETTGDGRIVYANHAMLSMAEVAEENILGTRVADLFEGEDRARLADLIGSGSIAAGHTISNAVFRLNRHDIMLDIVPFDQETQRSLIIVKDVSGPMRASKALKESEQRFRRFFEEDLSGAFITTAAGQIIACNPAFARIVGFDSPAEVKKASMNIIYPEDADRKSFLKKLYEEKRLERYESVMRRKDGTRIYIIENTIGVFDHNGELV